MAEGPDGARAWVVAVAALTMNLITAGIYRAQGIMFVAFINVYHVDRKDAALPFSVRSAMRNLLAPAVGIFGQKYGAPAVIVTGGVISTLSALLCYFPKDIISLTLIWGVINGSATALITTLPQVVIGQYFEKYRTTAIGFSYSGGCSGALVFPFILQMLLECYGLSGTFIILSGILMNTIPAGMLLKKPPWLANGRKGTTLESDKSNMQKNIYCLNESEMCQNTSIAINNTRDELYNKKYDKQIKEADKKNFTLSLGSTCSFRTAGSLTRQMYMTDLQRAHTAPNISVLGLNNRNIKSNPDYIYDTDLDYLKRMSDLVFQMFSMELPNIEMSYRAILLEIEQDQIWHPEKNEIMQEIENIYLHIEKSLEMNQISNDTIRANGLYMKRTLFTEKISASKKAESLRGVKKYFKNYKERARLFDKIRSAPNISNIYNEIARKDYIVSKMRQLYNTNEIRVISLLCQYNPRDVLRVLFHIRSLYRLYSDHEFIETSECNEICERSSNSKESSDEEEDWIEIKTKITKDPKEIVSSTTEVSKENMSITTKNTFSHHVKIALKLHMNPLFLLICCSRTVFHLATTPVMPIIVDFAMDKGFKEDEGSYIIGAISLGDLVGRLCSGWITDRGYATLPRYMLAVMIMQGISTISIPFMNTRWTLLPSISLFGIINSSLFIRHPVLITKYLEPSEQSIAAGCMDFIGGILCLIIPMYIGFFRDQIGSYNPIFYINGTIVLLAAMVWIFEPYIKKKREQVLQKT